METLRVSCVRGDRSPVVGDLPARSTAASAQGGQPPRAPQPRVPTIRDVSDTARPVGGRACPAQPSARATPGLRSALAPARDSPDRPAAPLGRDLPRKSPTGDSRRPVPYRPHPTPPLPPPTPR